MNKSLGLIVVLLLVSLAAWAAPTVDGTLAPGEYAHSLSVVGGTATVSWSDDDKGGLYLAVSAPTMGWVGLGLGSSVMDGAWIFMGYVKNGQAVFSEQLGSGHSHRPVEDPRTDQHAVKQLQGTTTIEFHLASDKLPTMAKQLPFIVAFSGSADLKTFHEDNLDGGTLTRD